MEILVSAPPHVAGGTRQFFPFAAFRTTGGRKKVWNH